MNAEQKAERAKAAELDAQMTDTDILDELLNHKSSGWGVRDFDHATKLAELATLQTSETYLPVDKGDYCSPRYTIVTVPKIGAEVSMGFNGDYYPQGTIIRVSESGRVVTTSTGKTFYRRRLSSSWLHDGMWSLVAGHVSRLNPHF